MTLDEAIETLRYEIDEECHCEYIANEIRFLIAEIEEKRLKLTETHLETNSQKAEIKRLNGVIKNFKATKERKQAEIERLKKILAEEEEKYKLCAKRFYKVGVKDFAERLKKESYPFPCAIGVENAVTIRTIDDLAKEMVGDTE